MGECAKLKTVTQIKQSSTHDTFIAENVYLKLFFLWDWKPAERLLQNSQKNDGVSFTLSEDHARSTGRPERTELPSWFVAGMKKLTVLCSVNHDGYIRAKA